LTIGICNKKQIIKTNSENIISHKTLSSMNTRMDVVISLVEKAKAAFIFSIIEHELTRLENKFSRFCKESIIYILNNSAHKQPVVVDEETYSLLSACQKYNQKTLGFFDISLGLLATFRREGKDTNDSELTSLIGGLGMDKIEINPDDHRVYFKNNQIQIDLGAIGKGYALEQIGQILLSNDIRNAFISFGESSVLSVGTHPYGDSWPVGIRNIYNDKEVIYSFNLKNQSLSTSGGAGHIINPKTGEPVKVEKTVSVLSDSAVEAEVLSTAIIASDDKNQILNQFTNIQMVEVQYHPDKTYQIDELYFNVKVEDPISFPSVKRSTE